MSTMSSLELRTKITARQGASRVDSATAQRLRDRVTNELTTTFASHYSSKFWPVRSVPVEVHNFCSEGVRA